VAEVCVEGGVCGVLAGGVSAREDDAIGRALPGLLGDYFGVSAADVSVASITAGKASALVGLNDDFELFSRRW
jgi:hypothetical protein